MSSPFEINRIENEIKLEINSLRQKATELQSNNKILKEKMTNIQLQIKSFVSNLDEAAKNITESHNRMADNFLKLINFVCAKIGPIPQNEIKELIDSMKPPLTIVSKRVLKMVEREK